MAKASPGGEQKETRRGDAPSGLRSKIITAGTGPKPSPSDTVLAHYRGTLIDGTEFDSSSDVANR